MISKLKRRLPDMRKETVASLIAAFTIQYDPDEEAQFEAAAAVLLTTVFAAVTIPMWAWILSLCFV